VIGQVVAHYRILEKLGEGGMGEVYLAEDTRLRRKVALKILPQQFAADSKRKKRFMREAIAASALSHPNAAVVYEANETADGIAYISMEYVPGDTGPVGYLSRRHLSKSNALFCLPWRAVERSRSRF
jgi:serine/threonine-protein kinase